MQINEDNKTRKHAGSSTTWHRSQIFFYLLSAFIAGVFLASVFDFSKSSILIVLIIATSIVALVPSLRNLDLLKEELLVVFMLIALVVGIVRFNQINSSQNSLEQFIGQEVVLRGYINDEPEVDGNKMRFVFKTGNERILVTTNAFPRREFGEQLLIKGELKLPHPARSRARDQVASQEDRGAATSNGIDYVTYLKKDSIRTTIFYPKEIEMTSINLSWNENVKRVIYRSIFSLKNKFQNAINLSISEPNAAFINGILLGARQNIPDGLKEAFNKTGTTHILAISGYNIMIISWAILEGLIFFFRRRIAFWISVVAIILFVILTGASASVVRAAVMGLLLSFAHGYGRLYDQKNSIVLAGAVMIYHNPLVLVFDIGFQLSFAAVLGLIYLYPRLDYRFYKVPKLGGLKELILMTLSAQTAVSPLLIYYFGNFSLLSLPANVLILPFLPYAMLAGFVTGLAGMVFFPLGQLMGYIAWAITSYQISIVEFFAFL